MFEHRHAMKNANPNITAERLRIPGADVKRGRKRFGSRTLAHQLATRNIQNIEASSSLGDNWVALPGEKASGVLVHPVLAALDAAYSDHLPVVLSPDMIWMLIVQGFGTHIRYHAELFRKELTGKESGKETLVVESDLLPGGSAKTWPEVVSQMTALADESLILPLGEMMIRKFSTTTSDSLCAQHIVFLDSVSEYFEYEVEWICGIPEIQLEGTEADWQLIHDSLKDLKGFEIDEWVEGMVGPISNFVKAFQGEIDREFWQSIYHAGEDCGGIPYFTGWISRFFAYVDGSFIIRNGSGAPFPEKLKIPGIPEPLFIGEDDNNQVWKGLVKNYAEVTAREHSSYPSGIASVPFRWIIPDQNFNMLWHAGFMGVHQEEDKALKPGMVWAVSYAV